MDTENNKRDINYTSFSNSDIDNIVTIVKYDVAENKYHLTKQKYESLMFEDYTKYYELIKMDEAIYENARRRYEMLDNKTIKTVKKKLSFFGYTPYDFAKKYNLIKGLQ